MELFSKIDFERHFPSMVARVAKTRGEKSKRERRNL